MYRILEAIKNIDKDLILIAIDGKSGSGKSSLANKLSKVLDCNVFHMDDFFLQSHQRTKERFLETGGNIDHERFYIEVIKGINSNKEFRYQKFDCKTMSLKDYVNVIPKKINIIEGVYSMHPLLFDYYDMKIFLDIDDGTQIQRILSRNGEIMLNRFINEWIPLENKYFNEFNIKNKSDILINDM